MFNIFNQSSSEDILRRTTIIKVTLINHIQTQHSKFNNIISKPLTFTLVACKSRGARTHVRCKARAAVHASHLSKTHR